MSGEVPARALPRDYQDVVASGIEALRSIETALAPGASDNGDPAQLRALRDVRSLAARLANPVPQAWTHNYMLTILSPLDLEVLEDQELASTDPRTRRSLQALRRFLADYLAG